MSVVPSLGKKSEDVKKQMECRLCHLKHFFRENLVVLHNKQNIYEITCISSHNAIKIYE